MPTPSAPPRPAPIRPAQRPANPNFSSGPCAKRPGWRLDALSDALVGRSHRSAEGRAKLRAVIERSAALLGIPEGWKTAIVPASDTGAVELALWALLDARGAEMIAFESFGAAWAQDVARHLALPNTRIHKAAYGALPDLSGLDWSRDVVFAFNGTTSGVRIPDGGWIDPDRGGLAICDATSAAFAMELPWDRLDVVTWSWQKALGGEAAHGMIALSPRALARLEAAPAPRPLPRIFRLTTATTEAAGALIGGIFSGDTINTPSMLCVEDALDSLAWAERIGGLPALKGRAEGNLALVADWVARSGRVGFLAATEATRSCTSICLRITAPWFVVLDAAGQGRAAKAVAALLEAEGVAYDIASYRDAPPGLRIWGGATVEASDIAALLPWIDWAIDAIEGQHA
ncbi:phosphoserine aminotransferase [Endobacter medicaginis]|uniref:phosphoserine transaminase n=2 Tax=Endobacter medicaginis TaxID=1181271 RepID=A0A839V190_9PROT|nr:phosphoserine transaminase [Endobacter medicaginis]MBB3174304.1 phosphoserine aminotransferase [Endobacter medicaginis]MCX5476186.1 phosphoserine transaminase [Endobacter medicaginis]